MTVLGKYGFLLKVQWSCSFFSPLRNLTSNNMSNIKTFVFLDLETTGLPHLEHNKTKITEFCAVAVQADHIELGCFPRVHNKLSFCFNPGKLISPDSSNITGLSNELLEHQGNFSSDIVDIIKKWLDANKKPICFVAHNGNRFDYPIFRAEIEKTGNSLPDDVLCIDSIEAFKYIDNNKGAEEKLPQGVPFEFDDDFDEVLCQASEEFERSLAQQKLTPEEVQKINETTPKKQIVSSHTQNGKNPSVIPKREFGHRRMIVRYNLPEVYTRLTSKQPINAHEAEGDVVMLITCAAVYGEKFVAYANERAVKFSEMPVMKPGKKIGT